MILPRCQSRLNHLPYRSLVSVLPTALRLICTPEMMLVTELARLLFLIFYSFYDRKGLKSHHIVLQFSELVYFEIISAAECQRIACISWTSSESDFTVWVHEGNFCGKY